MNSAEDIWQCVLSILKTKLTSVAINTWFDDCKAVEIDDTNLVLMVPTDYKRGVIASRFKDVIEDALREIFSGDFSVTLISETDVEHYNHLSDNSSADLSGIDYYTFENFIVGPSNSFAHAAAKAVAEEQTKAYNPLFIYGESGLGKTHLLYAIKHEICSRHPEYNVVFVRGNDFMNELISAIQMGKNVDFREKYRSADLFLMDDIQIIAGKNSTQEEFFHTFNTLYEAQKQIVFTSDRPPSEMYTLADRLRTRFESGLLADIQPPDYETRTAIIKKKSQQIGLILSDSVIEYIAENMTSNVRQLEGAIKKIRAHRDLDNLKDSDINVTVVSRIIKDMFKEKTENIPTPEEIIEETAKYFGYLPSDLTGQSRNHDKTMARQLAMYQIRKLTNLSLKDIGTIFEGRDHSTVLTSIKKVEDNMTDDLTKIIKDITANINARG